MAPPVTCRQRLDADTSVEEPKRGLSLEHVDMGCMSTAIQSPP
ncbi:rCG56772 [Rattus norvegicus]|uniref:RCG56772 n=1 Tax=Rattus norvegicus TaxID=10116 RepID=A6KJL8_RAT|nr:rCG56772 [Rattus norvegicus]